MMPSVPVSLFTVTQERGLAFFLLSQKELKGKKKKGEKKKEAKSIKLD